MWHASFDLVTNFFTSVGYFDDEAEHEAVVKGFVKCCRLMGQIACGLSQCGRLRTKNLAHQKGAKMGRCFTSIVASTKDGLRKAANLNGRKSAASRRTGEALETVRI